MVSINYAFKEICCKIVFYGPGLSGKTSNLRYVHQKIPSQTRGELISLATDQDRTLFFDFLPVDIGQIHGFSIKFQLYTVPGQVYYNATRKLVLRGVDGLVFVADSQKSKMDENIESYQNLVENLESYGYDIEETPLVFQYNKRDLSDISLVEEMERILNPKGLFYFEAVAIQGIGVFDTLKCISKLVLAQTKGKKVVSERETKVKEAAMAESKSTRIGMGTDLESVKTPASVGVFQGEQEISTKKKTDVPSEEGIPSVWGKKVSSSQIAEREEEVDHVLPHHKTEHGPPPPEKTAELETEKKQIVQEGLSNSLGEEKGRMEQSFPKLEVSPTIISWSATRRDRGPGPRGFFLWRFFKNLLNR